MTAYEEAVKAWKQSENNRREFAHQASLVSGEQTKELAAVLKISRSTVENYRNAYQLYYQMNKYFETRETSTLWEELYPSIWIAAARATRKFKMSPEKVLEHLQHAKECDLSVDAFAAHVDSCENKVPEWMRRFIRIKENILKMMDDFMPELEPEKQTKLRKLFRDFVDGLEELVK
jgi:DNA repair ATPase RecN